MSGHTQGPWKVLKHMVISEHEQRCIYQQGTTFKDSSEAHANAHLIAAAPELLEALDEAEKVIMWAAQEARGRVKAEIVNGWIDHAVKIKATINKATT